MSPRPPMADASGQTPAPGTRRAPGGDDASGVFERADTRLWLPVSAYLIEHPRGKFLVDTGWARDMSPAGEFDKKAQIKSLGSWVLYKVNQGRIPLGTGVTINCLCPGARPASRFNKPPSEKV